MGAFFYTPMCRFTTLFTDYTAHSNTETVLFFLCSLAPRWAFTLLQLVGRPLTSGDFLSVLTSYSTPLMNSEKTTNAYKGKEPQNRISASSGPKNGCVEALSHFLLLDLSV